MRWSSPPNVPRLANTLCIAMPGVPAATQVMALDLAGVMVSAGAACSSGKVGAATCSTAWASPDDIAECAIRVSLGLEHEPMPISIISWRAWGALYARTRASAA